MQKRFNQWRECPTVERVELVADTVENAIEVNRVLNEINQRITKYDFPSVILADVHKRLVDCPNDPHYALQQLRYLDHIIATGNVSIKEATGRG